MNTDVVGLPVPWRRFVCIMALLLAAAFVAGAYGPHVAARPSLATEGTVTS